MVIGDRLKELRESKELSQGDIEKRTGLLRCYISRVENGHTVPAVATLEKMARALEVPMYQLFHDGAASPSIRNLRLPKGSEEWGSKGTRPTTCPSCASYSQKWNRTTKNSCSTWRKRSQSAASRQPPTRTSLVRQR
jgi:transcriptional regulator with XRE-family HTH domain